jgi:DNA-binding MarR family transcriptional regulator
VLFVEIQRTADWLARRPAQLLRQHRLSATQYNVLRILRGAPEGLLCGEIAARMITREPDITRLLDRLEKRGLVGRCRQDVDRRRVLTRITPEGLNLLSGLDAAVCALHRRQLGHLGAKQLTELSRMIATCRSQLD